MTQVTHPQLVKALVKPPIDILVTLSVYKADLWHGATGVAGEAGELLEGVVGIVTASQNAVMFAEAFANGRENICEESGDIYFYMEQLVQRTEINLDWDAIATFARNQHIGPDMMLGYASLVAVWGSKVLDTVKKCAVYNKDLDLELLTEQLTELAKWTMTIGYMFGVERVEALTENINKLSKRYEGLSYSDKAAHDRADKVGAPVVERKPFPGEPQNGVNQAIADDINAGRDPSQLGK